MALVSCPLQLQSAARQVNELYDRVRVAHYGRRSTGVSAPHHNPTPDEIFDVWLAELSGVELKVLLYIRVLAEKLVRAASDRLQAMPVGLLRMMMPPSRRRLAAG